MTPNRQGDVALRSLTATLPFVAILVVLAPYLWPPDQAPTSPFSDVHQEHAPNVQLLATGLWRDGELPRWNVHDFGGMPTIGDPLAGMYNPTYWLLTLRPSVHAFGLLVVGYTLVGALGFILYARILGLSIAGAAAGATVFAIGGKLPLHLVTLGHAVFAPFLLIPLLLWTLHRAARQLAPGRVAAAATLSGVLAVSLAPQLLFYSAWIVVAIGVHTAWSTRRRTRALTALALCAVLGSALAAVHLFPIVEFAGEFSRGQPGLFDPADWTSDDWPGAQWFLDSMSGRDVTPERVLSDWQYYLGGAGLFLAILGLLSWPAGDPRRRLVWLHGVLAIVLLLYGLGPAGRIEPFLTKVPGFALFRLPTKALIVLALPLAVLVGLGVDAVAFAPQRRRRLVGTSGTIIALLLLGAGHAPALHGCMFVLVVAAATVVHYLVAAPSSAAPVNPEGMSASSPLGRFPNMARLLLIAALAVDTGSVVGPHVKTQPEEELTHSAPGVVLPDDLTKATRLAEIRRPLWKPGLPQLLVRQRELETLAGFNALIPWRFVLYASAAGGFNPFENLFDVQVPLIERNEPELFDLLGVTHFLRAPGSESEGWLWERSGSAFPRAYLVPGPVLVPERQDDDPLVAELRNLVRLSKLDSRKRVLLHGKASASALKAAGITPEVPLEPFRPVSITARTANRIRVDFDIERPGILVLNESFFPGWRARDGDAELPVLRANVLFRAVALQPGRHEILFEFSPASWQLGWWISVCAVLVTAGLGVFGIRRWVRLIWALVHE